MRTLLLLLGVALASPARADLAADVRAHAEAFARACTRGDVSGVVRLYAEDARVIWPGEPEEARGRAGLEELAADACRPDRGLEMAVADVEVIPIDPTHVAAVVHWQDVLRGPDGNPFRFRARATQVLVKTRRGWRFLVDHASIGLPAPHRAPDAPEPAR